MNLQYIMKNKIDEHQCGVCYAVWVRFDHEGNIGIYRLAFDEPSSCPSCDMLDKKIEQDPAFILSGERWFDL